jgi:hypothetical protein
MAQSSHPEHNPPSAAADARPGGARSDYLPYAAAALSGFFVCLAITIATGRSEAWDSGFYFILGIPVMCTLIFGISYIFPRRVWRWTLSMAVGQSIAITIGGGSLTLWPLAIFAMAILSVPQFICGLMGSNLAQRKGTRRRRFVTGKQG